MPVLYSIKMNSLWFKKNSWNLIGTFLGVLGVVTGYLFYRASLQIPALSFAEAFPAQAVIDYGVMSGSPVQLVRKDGRPVEKNVYSARLYVWNSGNVAFRSDAVLKNLEIAANDIEILDVKVARAVRPEITELVVERTGDLNGAQLRFKILEPGDGAALDVLYAAPDPRHFDMVGAIEGVKSFSPIEMVPSGEVALKTAWEAVKPIVGVGVLLLGVMVFAWVAERVQKMLPKNKLVERMTQLAGWSVLIILGFGLIFGTFSNARKRAVGAPIDFVPVVLKS